jgi:hypothetical protein
VLGLRAVDSDEPVNGDRIMEKLFLFVAAGILVDHSDREVPARDHESVNLSDLFEKQLVHLKTSAFVLRSSCLPSPAP